MVNKKQRWIIVSLLILVGTGYGVYSRKSAQVELKNVELPKDPSYQIPESESENDFSENFQDQISFYQSVEEEPKVIPAKEENHQPLTHEMFKELLQAVYQSIPTVEELSEHSSDEAHHQPQALMEVGSALGELAQALKENPAYSVDAVEFYRNCMKNEKFPKSVRALCLADLKEIETGSKEAHFEDSSIPEDVRHLSNQL